MGKLGAGNFGSVCKGVWSLTGGKTAVALKMLKPNSQEQDKVKFLQEAAIMGQFSHENIVRLYGVVTLSEPVSETNATLLGIMVINMFLITPWLDDHSTGAHAEGRSSKTS